MGRVQLEKKIGKLIFIHSFITFLGEHLNVNNVINALLCLCSCFYVHVFLRFSGFFFFFFFDRGVGGWGVSYPNLFWFCKFFLYLQGPLGEVVLRLIPFWDQHSPHWYVYRCDRWGRNRPKSTRTQQCLHSMPVSPARYAMLRQPVNDTKSR